MLTCIGLTSIIGTVIDGFRIESIARSQGKIRVKYFSLKNRTSKRKTDTLMISLRPFYRTRQWVQDLRCCSIRPWQGVAEVFPQNQGDLPGRLFDTHAFSEDAKGPECGRHFLRTEDASLTTGPNYSSAEVRDLLTRHSMQSR